MGDSASLAPPSRRSRRAWVAAAAALAAVVLFAAGVRLWTIRYPFQRNMEGLGSFYGILARNYFRHDLSDTLGVPVQSMGRAAVVKPVFYAHHPPLVPMFIAAAYLTFDHPRQADYVPPEWLTRLPSALFTLACVVAIFALVRNRAGPRAAIFSAAIFVATPMVIYFGGQPDVINSQLVFFVLLTIAAYLRFHDSPSVARLAVLCAAFVPAGLTDWPAYYVVIVLGLHYVLSRPWKTWGWIIAFGLFSAATFALAYGQIYLIAQDWKWIAHLVERRTIQNETDAHSTFTWMHWISGALIHHNLRRHTLPVCILALAGIATFIWRRNESAPRFLRLLLAWAALHVLVGRQGTFQHEWWWWPLTPGLAISAGMMLDWLCARFERRWPAAQPIASAIAAALLIALATWTTLNTIGSFDRYISLTGDFPYSARELGQAIRSAAPANASVLLAEDDDALALWYYADRPIVQNVWQIETVDQQRRDPRWATLPWGFREPWPFPPAALVMPRVYLNNPSLRELDGQLRDRFAVRQTPQFLIFNLSGAKQEGPASKEAGPDAD